MKRTIDNLAIFSGQPSFKEKLHVGRPNLGNTQRFLERTQDILERRWFSNNGHYVQEFEKELAKLLGVKHCIVMCNATVALEITIRALGLKGEVIVPSFTFVATAHALQWQEITPVFCDIDPETHLLDPACVEKMITPRTSGIIGVHLWGRPCAIEALTDIAERFHLQLMFDAAHAFACSHRGKMIGNFGRAEVFSFHATKFFNTFEGGAVATNDDALAEKIRLMKNFGFRGYDNVIYIGTNGKMNELSAAMGLTGLESLNEFIAVNRENYSAYKERLRSIPGVKTAVYDEKEKCNFHYVIAEVDQDKAGLSRDELLAILHAENVLARRYFYPGCHQMEPYRSYFPHAHLLLKNTEALTQKVLSLPNGTSISAPQIQEVCDIIECAVHHAPEIKKRFLKTQPASVSARK